jgi:gamma-glutamyltranspeptidase / glutathione hydrolase
VSDSTRYSPRGLVCSVDHLASAAGVALLRAGGSAVDAAVAASAVLAVTSQHMCGMGGDLVGVVSPGRAAGPPEALVAVGAAGSRADAQALRTAGHRQMPFRGLDAVTMPGCVDGWLALHARFGRRPLAEVLEPARSYAADGFPVSPLLAAALPRIADVAGAEELVGDRLPVAGELRRRPALARALAAIGAKGRDGWYGGEFGAGLVRVGDGLFRPGDLDRVSARWEDPVSMPALGWTLHAPPAPTAGYLPLAAAAVLDQLAVPADLDEAAWAHLLIEACRVTGYDRDRRLFDGAAPADLLDPTELATLADQVRPDRAGALVVPGVPGGTAYLCVVDATGQAVSLSQSNAAGFGAHVAVPEVGVFLQNRGVGFSLRPGAPNELAPGRRPNSTLAPVLALAADSVTALGTMGGDAQPQIVLQLLARLRAGATPAAAVEAPRWALAGPAGTGFDTWDGEPGSPSRQLVRIEDGAPPAWYDGLRARGHEVVPAPAGGGFGHAHVARHTDGVLAGAADPRALTGAAAGW